MQPSAPPVGLETPQPALPSYAEAMRTAVPSTFNYPRTVDHETHHPGAPATIYGTQTQSAATHPQYPNQSNYSQMPLPATVGTYLPTYATNVYGQPSEDCIGGPTTVHIIRPVSTQSSTCCTGTRGRLLGIILGLIILGAILRITMNAWL